jgi:hypothetical protein
VEESLVTELFLIPEEIMSTDGESRFIRLKAEAESQFTIRYQARWI